MLTKRLAATAALAFAFTAPTAAQPAAVRIAVWSFGFAPNPIQLKSGVPVTLVFENRSGSSHDFTAPGFFQHARMTAGAAREGEIELGPHETKSITLIPSRGTYQAHCSHFLHKQLGMNDYIYVY
jgi:plastocyanin